MLTLECISQLIATQFSPETSFCFCLMFPVLLSKLFQDIIQQRICRPVMICHSQSYFKKLLPSGRMGGGYII